MSHEFQQTILSSKNAGAINVDRNIIPGRHDFSVSIRVWYQFGVIYVSGPTNIARDSTSEEESLH